MLNLVKLPVLKSNVALRVSKGHFVTNHSHINYYIDVTFQKSRLSEAQATAKALARQYVNTTMWTPSCAWTAWRWWAPAWLRS